MELALQWGRQMEKFKKKKKLSYVCLMVKSSVEKNKMRGKK